jgi:aspartate ammonia-lyase
LKEEIGEMRDEEVATERWEAVQPGSSIMPGKVNPVMAEMLNMVCFHILGHDAAITNCGAAGQLELNVIRKQRWKRKLNWAESSA